MLARRAFLLSSAAFLMLEGLASARPVLSSGAGRKRDLRLEGARAPIEVIEDALGVPHIRARSKHDAFFAQGYLVARDRLFQIDLGYRRGLGRMAEAFGARFVPFDRAARLLLFRGDVAAELAALPPGVLECAEGYVAGVNARIAELEADPAQLPLEYGLLGIAPLRWTVRDLVQVRNPSTGNVDDEVRRAQLAARGLLEADRLLDPLRMDWDYMVPEELDCAAVSEADRGILLDNAKPLPFGDKALAFYDPWLERADLIGQGSNAWTVAASRSASGHPILANDPHLGIGSFSPRHIAHLTAPGLDVIGAGAPGLPGIMQGHTDRFAFGRTNFHIDQADLFVLRTHPEDLERYWHKGVWKRFETVEESIPVRDGPAQTATLRYAQGRPVVSQDPARHRATALASVDLLPGANTRLAMVAINLAQDWNSLRAAFRIHASPTNFHYADRAGNTGWHAIGFAPVRPKHDGLLPAPGDGSYDWTGILPLEEMPHVYNPKQGWIASANAMNLPADYPYRERILSFTWTDPFRYDRIKAVLASQPKHRMADSIALQHDVLSLPAQALVALLPAVPTPEAAPAAALLRRWDCGIEADSAAALLYEMTLPELSARFRERIVPKEAQDLLRMVNLSEMLRLLAAPDTRFGADPVAARDAMLCEALAAGWAKAVAAAGADPAQWRWGDLHRVTIRHPLAKSIPAIAAAFPAIEGGRSGGDGTTVMARGVNMARGTDVIHGASWMMVIDTGAWDEARVIFLPGQSGDPRSPHYRDWYDDWIAGRTHRLAFSPEAVRAQAADRLTLRPAPRRT